jgi:hypothetical protein
MIYSVWQNSFNGINILVGHITYKMLPLYYVYEQQGKFAVRQINFDQI